MELNIKFDKKMLVKTANRVLDEYEYNGKTIREWADLIANPKTNADRLRAMSDEELAEFIARQRFSAVNPIADILGIDVTTEFIVGQKNALDWLRQEAHDA